MADPALEVRLLGPVDVRFDGSPLRVDTRKALALLAYLVVTDRPASRVSLATLLWPDSDDDGARGALRRTLSVLNGATAGALRIDRTSVSVEAARVDADVTAFRHAVATVRAHDHPGSDAACATCLATLEAAAALDRGDFMDGFHLRDSDVFDDWQRSEQDLHRRDLATILERLGAVMSRQGAWDRAVRAGRRWLELDPLHEPAHRLLMTIHATAGEPAAAVQQYRECVAVLDRELGVAPLPETTALYEQIRTGTFEARPLVPSDARDAIRLDGTAATKPNVTDLPLVGRDESVRTALAAHDRAATSGCVVALVGEAGIGKTRLGSTIVARIRSAGGRALAASPYSGEEGIAFGSMLALLRSGLTGADADRRLAALPPSARRELARLGLDALDAPSPDRSQPTIASHLAFLDGLVTTVDALLEGPVAGVLWLDGVESVDASTLEVLGYLLRRLERRRILVLLAWRPEDVGERTRAFVDSVERHPSTTLVTLGRLGLAAVGELVHRVLPAAADDEAFVADLYEESEGLPLYLVEALGSGTERGAALPSGIRALVGDRIATLGDVARQVLSTAAVIGRSFDLRIVRQGSGRSEEEVIEGLDELLRRGLIRELGTDGGDVRYEFGHAAFRDGAYDRTSLARRRLLHRRVADVLRSGHPRDARERLELAVLAAGHETSAGRAEAAADLYALAGDLARGLLAPRDAIAHYEAALALDHPRPGTVQRALGEVRVLVGDYLEGIRALEAAAALGEPVEVPAIELELGRAHGRRGDLETAASHLEAALSGPAGSVDDRLAAATLAERGLVAMRMGDLGAAAAFAADARRRAVATGSQAAVAATERVAGLVALARNELEAARTSLRRSLELAGLGTDAGLAIAAANALALAEAAAGEHDAAVRLLETALQQSRESGSRHLEAAIENNLADVLHAAGRQGDSMEHQRRAAALFAEVGGMPDLLDPAIWQLTVW